MIFNAGYGNANDGATYRSQSSRSFIMKTTALTGMAIVAVLGALLALPVLAQTGSGNGRGIGMAGQSAPVGGQMGMHGGHGGMQGFRHGMKQDMTPGMGTGKMAGRGAGLMTAEERTAHQQKMRQVKTVDECRKVQAEQHTAMEARAKEKGITLPAPHQNPCDNMKARGLIQ
jgi:hypothetical protein